MKYQPNVHDEVRKVDKEAIASVLKTFADTPLKLKDLYALLPNIDRRSVNTLVWRMAHNKTKWHNIKRTATGSYVWDSKARTPRRSKRTTTKVRPTPNGVVESPPTVTTEWYTVTTVDGKIILRRADGSVWVAKPLPI